VQYQAFKHTQISLSAGRTVSSSDYYLASQQTESTVVALNLNQQLFRKFNLSGGVSYTKTDYSIATKTALPIDANRSDDQVGVYARLSHPFLKRGSWAVFYQYSDNSSSLAKYTYQSDQVGFEVNYAF